MSKKIVNYIILIVLAFGLVTVATTFAKPSINKTVILQIQNYVKK